MRWPEPRWTAWLMPAGLAAAGVLSAIALLRYPNPELGSWAAVAAPTAFAALALVALFAGTRPRRTDPSGRRAGIVSGLVCGALWIGEISFNNFVDARWSDAASRRVVDDSVWALIALIILAVAWRESRRTTFAQGLAAGFWSGTLSGLVACLMALSLIVFFMPALLADPLNLAEYAARVPSGVPGMATYFAYETMTGAFAHLAVLGTIMGLLLGLLGSAAGMLTRRRPQP